MGYDDVDRELWGDSSSEEPPTGVLWSAPKMARYFDTQTRHAPWTNGFIMTNTQALAAQLKKWRESGKTEAEVKELIDFYVSSAEARGFNPGWKDFLYRAEKNSAMLRKPEPVKEEPPMKEQTPLERAREVGTYEAFLEVLRSPKIAKKYYDQYKEEHG